MPYIDLPAKQRMFFDVEGPLNLVLLVRGVRDEQVDFLLQLDGDMQAETRLWVSPKVSKGIFIQTPEGKHRYVFRAFSDIYIRTKILRRRPKANHSIVAFVKSTPTLPNPRKEQLHKIPPAETVVENPRTKMVSDSIVPDKALPNPKPTPGLETYEDRPIEIRLRMLADGMAEAFKKMPGQGRYERLLVARFDQRGPTAEDKDLGALVSAQLNTYLKRDHGFYLIERERLGDVLREIEMSMTGLVDPGKVAELGKMAGAQAMVVGSVSEMGEDFAVNARVISVETAEILVAQSITLPRKGMIALSEDSVVLRTKNGAVFRSLLVPGWGQYYNQQPVKAAVLISLEAALAGTAVALHLLGQKDEDAYSSPNFVENYPDLTPDQLAEKASDLKASAENYYQARNIFIYTAVGVWLYNILDSYVFGVDGAASHMLELNPVAGVGRGKNRALGLALGWRF